VAAWPLARLRGPAAVWRLRAEEAISVRDWDTAIDDLLAAREAGADAEEIALTLGGAYLEAGRPEAAAREFAALAEDLLADPSVALMAGAALYESGRYEEAREPLGIAAERFRQDFLPAYLRGMCDIALDKPKAAVRWFTSAAESLNPHLAEKRFEEMVRVMDGERGTGAS
jgi:tetratricopeptide (TPR) repeat protein